jgi:LacI family transcriptional regulator
VLTRANGVRGPATIQDVADRAGVSRAAVSKVIRNAYGVSPAMKDRVGAAIEELHYRPSVAARAMRGSSFTIGIELPGLENAFFTKVIAGATNALAGSRYQLIVAPASPDSEEGLRAIESLADRQVDGLVAISPLVTSAWLERVAERIPIVMIGRHDITDAYDTVTGDDDDGARQVMDHLLSLGHRRITHLTVRAEVTDIAPESPHAVRLAAYRRIMAEAGLADETRVERLERDSFETVREHVTRLLTGPDRPTAIFAGHDGIALPVLQARAELGMTPADVSVVGYDDIDIASHPAISLTTVDQSGHEMGRRTIELLLERITGRTEAVHHVITADLRVRGSTAPPS